MPGTASAEGPRTRKQLGAWATPEHLVELVIGRTVDASVVARAAGRPVRVLDPACGDGRFLVAAATRIESLGGSVICTGVDVDASALGAAARALAGHEHRLVRADALAGGAVPGGAFDVVIGNPPFLSQLATATTRGRAGRYGGAYADAAAEFLGLAVDAADPAGGRVGLVLPQSILASRDAGPVRAHVDRLASMRWSWWSPARQFDAEVLVCALGFERERAPQPADWTRPVLDALGVPPLADLRTDGTVGDRCRAGANFRDEYYALVGAVDDHPDGPPFVTSGAIEPGRCDWGRRPVRFAGRQLHAPRVATARLDDRMQRWAAAKLVPKVLVATQTRVLEAVADPDGAWVPGVPITTVVPTGSDPVAQVWAVAAVLTSPVASAAAWRLAAGTGLSARALRVGPSLVASLPWPAGDLGEAVDALRAGDVLACGRAVDVAYATPDADRLAWWERAVAGRMAA